MNHVGKGFLVIASSSALLAPVAPGQSADEDAVRRVVEALAAFSQAKDSAGLDTPQGHVEVEGRGTAILEKRGGRWLVVHTHTSGRRRQAR